MYSQSESSWLGGTLCQEPGQRSHGRLGLFDEGPMAGGLDAYLSDRELRESIERRARTAIGGERDTADDGTVKTGCVWAVLLGGGALGV